MRADRLLSILLLLQGHGRLPAARLAERLEVSERTISRDMDALSMAGVPVYAERGRNGGWVLAEDYRTDLTGLTEIELRSLVVGATPRILADLGLGDAADRAIVKVLAALPATRRDAAESARGHLHVDPSGWRRPDEAAPSVPLLDEALRRRLRVALTYERADGSVVDRRVDPHGLVAKGSTWYLVAAVEGELRTYRASRIRAVALLDEPARREPGFELAAYWQRSEAEFRAALPRFHATIRVSLEGLGKLRMGSWRFVRVEDASAPEPDGWVRCRIRADIIEVAVDCLLGLGESAEIVEPDELRARVVAAARAVLNQVEVSRPASPRPTPGGQA
jgi:predicted DNA-binding transcriptional regulator YafY